MRITCKGGRLLSEAETDEIINPSSNEIAVVSFDDLLILLFLSQCSTWEAGRSVQELVTRFTQRVHAHSHIGPRDRLMVYSCPEH